MEQGVVKKDRSLDMSVFESASARKLIIIGFVIVPYAICAVLLFMFLTVNARIKGIETATTLVNIERIFTKDKNYQWAIEEYEKLVERHKSGEILTRLAALHFKFDPANEGKAIDILQQAKKIEPKYWEPYGALAFIHLVAGREAAAQEEGEKALKLNRLDATTYNNLAWLYAKSTDPKVRNLDAALTYADKAVKLTNGTDPYFLDTLGEVYYQRGEHERAKEYVTKALSMAAPSERKPFEDHLTELFPDFVRSRTREGR